MKRSKTQELEKELGRWQKKVEDQKALLQKREEELGNAVNGLKEIGTLLDATMVQVAIQCGTKVTDEESGEVIGYRLELPRLSVAEILAQWEVRVEWRYDGGYYIGAVPKELK